MQNFPLAKRFLEKWKGEDSKPNMYFEDVKKI